VERPVQKSRASERAVQEWVRERLGVANEREHSAGFPSPLNFHKHSIPPRPLSPSTLFVRHVNEIDVRSDKKM
jgi:hypothetical protein